MPGSIHYQTYPHCSLDLSYLDAAYNPNRFINPEERSELFRQAQDSFIASVKSLAESLSSNQLLVGLSFDHTVHQRPLLCTFDFDQFLQVLNQQIPALNSIHSIHMPLTSFDDFEKTGKSLCEYVKLLDFTFDSPSDLIQSLSPEHQDAFGTPNFPVHVHASFDTCNSCTSLNKDLNGKLFSPPLYLRVSQLLTLFEYVKQ